MFFLQTIWRSVASWGMAYVFRRAGSVHALIRIVLYRVSFPRPPRLLIIQLAHMGDALMLTPVLMGLRREYPGVRVSLLLNSYTAPFFRTQSDLGLEHIWELDTTKFRKTGFENPVAADRSWQDLWFDQVILVRFSPQLLPYVLMGQYGRAIFYDYGAYPLRQTWVGLLTKTPVLRDANAVQSNVSLVAEALRKAGYPLQDLGPLHVSSSVAESQQVEACLLAVGARPQHYWVLAPGAPFRYRQWPTERYAALLGKVLAANATLMVFLIGSADERTLHQSIIDQLDQSLCVRVRSVAGDLSWGALQILIAGGRLFLGTDGGLMHLASATATPLLALYGPQMPEIFGPWQPAPGSKVLYKRRFCSPCWQRGCVSPDHYCMMDISVDEVQAALDEIFSVPLAVTKTAEGY